MNLPILLLLTALSLGCDTPQSRQVVVPTNDVRRDVERWIPDFSTDFQTRLDAYVTAEAIHELAQKEAARSWNARLKGGLKYADLLVELYSADLPVKIFASSEGLTPKGQLVLDTLRNAHWHGLVEDDYHVTRIDALLAIAADPKTVDDRDIKLRGEEAEALVGWFVTRQAPFHTDAAKALLDAIIRDETSPTPRLSEVAQHLLSEGRARAKVGAELELRLADGVLRYARDLKHFNLNRLDWREIRDAGGSRKLIYDRLRKTFEDLANRPETLEILEALAPQHPQYEALLTARKRYLDIADAGGWPSIPKFSLEKEGIRGPHVKRFRNRLAIEGYLPLPQELDILDQDTIDAAKIYMVTHQFRATQSPPTAFWNSLNVPVERRLRQIDTSIQAWRETRYDGEPNFVFVNIPDFHAEVFEDHKRVMRFRVVVGNNQRRCDPKTKKWTYPNATPVQMALMDHLEVNPFWNVPERIIEEEFEAEIERDPNWLEKNNYELVKSRQGNTWIRQKPGPQNALGIVKFIFPNRHNTYMHDTPKKKYFDYPVRAFSHGCVRVEHPEELARYLLTKDTLATSEEFEALVSSQQTKRFLVKDKMPVFFEYYIAQVGDDGHVHFLADIYRLDERRASGDTETFDSCLVPQKSQTAGDGELTNPAETGRDYGP